jgi:F0F1-type ATP synthase assembly protein I
MNSPNIWRHVYAGTSLALTILLLTFAGIWLDRHWGFKPWGTIGGAFIGIGVGLFNFIREFGDVNQ